ncbi:patatin-like phospholipase family protein [Geofilum rubicundum]|uniref:Patatin-like phospholipase n=1 Tax=Geofilum rubicundum JCM 15548 TaxID=1236989 RepID=A0A0E9LWN6_9BACT|nr:patatin family protein [Geofilum rubicundum]GAO29531.1 patatin-like phospholipase [Geofilum rubicundum JCM 15548]
MMQHQLFFDYLIGVSAGAAYSVSYVSRQYQRNLEVNRFVKDKRYCSLGNYLKRGSYFDWDFVYHTIPTQIIPFDYEAYNQSSSRLHVVVTNISTGKPEYKALKTNNPIAFRDWLTATSSLPFIARPKNIDNQLYMDGGLSDSIPVNKAWRMAMSERWLCSHAPKAIAKSLSGTTGCSGWSIAIIPNWWSALKRVPMNTTKPSTNWTGWKQKAGFSSFDPPKTL